MGDWRLVSVKYSGQTISMESFIKYKKEQIEAMQAELKKPRSARDMSRSSHYGLTDRYDIDKAAPEHHRRHGPGRCSSSTR